MHLFYNQIKYPRTQRENGIEGLAKFYLIYHGDKVLEIIPGGKPNEFHKPVIFALTNLNEVLRPNTEKYMVAFCVNFDLEPFEEYDLEKNTIFVRTINMH